MRQDQLRKESEKCFHGFYFGTTCEMCEALHLLAQVLGHMPKRAEKNTTKLKRAIQILEKANG